VGAVMVWVGVGVSRALEFEFGGVGVATGGVHTTGAAVGGAAVRVGV